ncbi:MAG: tetratricopeptide repeat protein [Deltaproteobacteria bacterium]|nr:tetratricopeptide repeat protein [Deltaproteobacteria bacterium]
MAISEQDPEEFFKEGLVLMDVNNLREAMVAFKHALEMRPAVPRYMSYYGLCWALNARKAREPVMLCEQAVKKEIFRPELFCNLGKVYMLRGNRQKALAAFRKGLELDSDYRPIIGQIQKMGVRRSPVIPFLKRNNPLNKFLGIVINQIIQRRGLPANSPSQ